MTLLDALDDAPGFADLASLERVDVGDGAWVDVLPGWVGGSGALFADLVETVPWHAFEREMYGRTVAVPRLVKSYDRGETLPDARLGTARDLLNAHYAAAGESPRNLLTRAGLNLYRDGEDSVAWHHDTMPDAVRDDTLIAIVSLGAPRTLSVRPSGGRVQERFDLGHGDLLVMGGRFQRTHEHAVAKTARAVGARISVQFRPTWEGAAKRPAFVERSDSRR